MNLNQLPVTQTYTVKSLEDLPRLKQIMEAQNMKPNFSLIARELGVDRRTVKKYYNGFSKSSARQRTSKVDVLLPVIHELLSDECPQQFYYRAHLWRYLVDNHQLTISESAFRHYVAQHPELQTYFTNKSNRRDKRALLRFETSPGQQLQIDWKEDFRFLTSDGELLSLNIFVGILSYSRYAVYVVTFDKKQETLFEALDEVFESIGGIPTEIVSDNMKTIMDQARTENFGGKVNIKFDHFSKDYQFKLVPCVAGRPSTKGKVETQMKLLDELNAYQGQLTTEELIEKVSMMNFRKNMHIHGGTGKSPMRLLEIEKDFLQPLPSKAIRSLYQRYHHYHKVNASGMVTYLSNQYSVPPEYIGKTLLVQSDNNYLRIYDNTKLVTVHQISHQKLNYQLEHYVERLEQQQPYRMSDDIEEMARDQLRKIGEFYQHESNE